METRRCEDCGEEWRDTGDYECPFCESSNTVVIADDDEDDEDE